MAGAGATVDGQLFGLAAATGAGDGGAGLLAMDARAGTVGEATGAHGLQILGVARLARGGAGGALGKIGGQAVALAPIGMWRAGRKHGMVAVGTDAG